MLDPDKTPEDDGWKPICDDCEPQCDDCPDKCKQCDVPCRECPEFTDADRELLDNLFGNMTDEEIQAWAEKEVGDDEIPF